MESTGRGGWRRRRVDQDIFVGSSCFQLPALQNPSSTWVRNYIGGDGHWSMVIVAQTREMAATSMLSMLATTRK